MIHGNWVDLTKGGWVMLWVGGHYEGWIGVAKDERLFLKVGTRCYG